ncbi:MAG: ParB/RepB/Spo0J family partition protein [Clostridia bacterium]|nr:ParB/RepB/Spo0J family partition protein [Clostridia bacterium]
MNIEKAIPIPLEKLYDFPNHPFKVNDDKEMENMVETVKTGGIIMPLVVRQRNDGNYEIISGHRRKMASQKAGLKEVPCIIRDLSDDEATIIMVDSNMQRERILPSEKAFAYKMKLEAQKHQGQRTDLTSSQVATKLNEERTATKIGSEFGESKDTVYRYIRLTELIPELLELVDKEKDGMAFSPAVEISYLKEDEQYILLNLIQFNDATPSQTQAKYMKKLSQEGRLTTEKMEEIMGEQKPNQVEKIKIKADKIQKLLPKEIVTEQQTEEFIIKCIKEHNQREERKRKMIR